MQIENEKMGDALPVALAFNPEIFNARLKEVIPFSDKTLEQINMVKALKIGTSSFEDIMIIVSHLYDNIEDETYNQALFKTLKTKKQLNVFSNIDMNVNLLTWKIDESKVPFTDIKYKTVTSERADAYKIIEDKTFGCTRPEIVQSITNFKTYELRAKYTDDVTTIPYRTIFENLLELNKTLPYFFEYIVSKVLGLRQHLTVNQLIKLSDKTLFEILCWLHYRSDKEFKNSVAWNVNISQRTKVEALGYFTISEKNGTIGNFWVDDRFRNKGLAKTMMLHITKNILPNHDYLFITTKNETMKKHIKDCGGQYVGKCYPYIKNKDSDKNEHISVFLNPVKYPDKEIPFSILIDLDSWSSTQPEFSSELYKKFENNFPKSPDCELFEMTTLQVYQEWLNPSSEHITILGVTKDGSVLPEFKDSYLKEIVVYWCLVVLDNKTNQEWYYPLTGLEGDKYQISLHEKFIGRAKPFTMEVTKEVSYDEDFNETKHIKIVRNGSHPIRFQFEEFDTDIQISSNGKSCLFSSVKDFIKSEAFQSVKYGADLHPYRFNVAEGGLVPKYLDGDGKVVLACGEKDEVRHNKGIFDLI